MPANPPNDIRRTFDLEDNRALEVVITHEGVIMDAIEGDTVVGTVGMMADEWFEWLQEGSWR